MYREQEFVERCVCNDPAVGPCGSCGRARCANHLERGLCNRCNQAIGRELAARSNQRFVVASVSGTALTVGTMIAHLTFGIVIGLPLAFATFFGLRAMQRRKLIALMGPALAASKGELPQPERKPDIPANSTISPIDYP